MLLKVYDSGDGSSFLNRLQFTAILNLGAADVIDRLDRIRLSANWMAASSHPGEGAALYVCAFVDLISCFITLPQAASHLLHNGSNGTFIYL